MYRDHCTAIIAPAMLADMTIFRRGVMFAVCSIRQPTINVPGQLDALFDPQDGDENPLFGHKFAAWTWISDDAKCALLWNKLCLFEAQRHQTKGTPTREAALSGLLALLEVPGLGIVKAAFILQLMGFDVACLDARNVTREGRNPRAFRTDGKSPEQLRTKAAAYIAETFGKGEHYWDAWCADVGAAYDRTPQEISELHLAIVPRDFVPF